MRLLDKEKDPVNLLKRVEGLAERLSVLERAALTGEITQILLSQLSFYYGETTISGGAINASGLCFVNLTGEGNADDNLDTINNGEMGQILILSARRSTHDITVRSGTDNIYLDFGRDMLLERSSSGVNTVALIYNIADSAWQEIGRGNNASGLLGTGAASELTISSGSITITGSYHTVDTEGDAASDDLDTIVGGEPGDILVLGAADSARTVNVLDTGSFRLAGAFAMNNAYDRLVLLKQSTVWVELSRSDNAV